MSYMILSLVELILFIGTLLIVFYLLIPKSIKYFRSWKTSGKDVDLSNFILSVIVSLFILSGDFIIFIRALKYLV